MDKYLKIEAIEKFVGWAISKSRRCKEEDEIILFCLEDLQALREDEIFDEEYYYQLELGAQIG